MQHEHRALPRARGRDGDVEGVKEQAGGAEGGVEEVLPDQDRARPLRHRLREAECLWGSAITGALHTHGTVLSA